VPTEHAPAKVNLFLHLTGKRDDGYHLLDSLAVFAAIGDEVRAEAADDLSLALAGPFAEALGDEPDNLVLRAARALALEACVPAHARITLTKSLPVASGIGGGSADAAATIRACARLWNVSPGADRIAAIAGRLGADVPVCLASRPARMGGIGEVLTEAPALPDCGLVLVNPGVAVSTQDVFRARRGPFSGRASLPASWSDARAMAATLAILTNDLAPPAIALQPVIGTVLAELEHLPNCLLARMSGSGATCWGLFDSGDAAESAAQRITRAGWWVWGGGLHERQ